MTDMKAIGALAAARSGIIPIALGELEDVQLDEYVQALLPSELDADRTALSIFLVERHKRCASDEQWAWIRDCETLYFLATTTFESKWRCPCGVEYSWLEGLPDWDIPPFISIEDLPPDFVCPKCLVTVFADFQACEREPLYRKYAQDAKWTWSSFAMETLNMSPGSASARKRVWEVYHVGLGWTVEMMMRAYRSCMGLAVGEMARSLPEGGDPKLFTLLLGGAARPLLADGDGQQEQEAEVAPASWYETWDYLKEKRREREAEDGIDPPLSFSVEELRSKQGEDLGITVTAWIDELAYTVGTFMWDKGLQPDLKGVFKESLLEKLQK